MKTNKATLLIVMVAVLLSSAVALGQEAGQLPAKGTIEFGGRGVWGDVYGRPDLPFTPSITSSKFDEYRDLRNGFFVKSINMTLDDVLGSKNYFTFKSNSSLYKDQSYLATFGQLGKFKLKLRYDQIPHTFTNTSRTLATQTSSGVYTFPATVRQALQNATATSLPSLIATQVVPGMSFVTPSLERKSGGGDLSYNFTENWSLNAMFSRENEVGSRPIGLLFNSSPSASATAGSGVELPEPIDYFTNSVKVGTEYGRRDWGIQAGYRGSFFQNNISTLTFDNPFRFNNETYNNPLKGQMALYPDNQAHWVDFAGAFSLAKHVRVMAAISPGWQTQNAKFLPYTANSTTVGCGSDTGACNTTASLPDTSLHGEKQTLAVNTTIVAKPYKKVELKAIYRQYDYNDNNRVREWQAVMGDSANPTEATENPLYGFNKKNIEFTGAYLIGKKSSVKAGYEGEIYDRNGMRDVKHSIEHSFVGAFDLNPRKDILFRLSYRHQDRRPEAYEDDAFEDVSGGIPADQIWSRRFDEAARLRDRADALLQWDANDRLTFSASYGTVQDNYNQRGGINSPNALNFLSGQTYQYYAYGLLKDISYNYNFSTDFILSPNATVFAEYTNERYNRQLVSRYRAPGSATLAVDCSISGRACDSANNDWGSSTRDFVNTYDTGVDFSFGKKAYLTMYYSLSSAAGNVLSRAFGNPGITTGADKFILTGTNTPMDYPETVQRSHQVGAIFKFKLTKNVMPKIEYRYEQYDNRDYQTGVMTPYMGCVSGLPPSAPVPGCTAPLIGTPRSFWPYSVVGDPSAARFLFLGADNPSYRAHYLAATVQYTF